jgi:hypothetical protein
MLRVRQELKIRWAAVGRAVADGSMDLLANTLPCTHASAFCLFFFIGQWA